MFERAQPKSSAGSAFATLELIFHASVRQVRKGHGNAVIGLLLNIFQTVLMIGILYALMWILGTRGAAVRGDYLLYIMSGIFMFMTHIKTLGAVAGADGPVSAMMLHAPMNTIIAIAAAALSTLYLQILSAASVLYLYHVLFNPIVIYQPVGAVMMLLLSWASGIGVGMILLAAKPWAPDVFGIVTMVYMRANMIASGKMFLANNTPGHILQWFTWNPLFHTIDQGRGFIFMNYHPHYSSISYPVKVTAVCFVIGLMAEFYTRKHISVSWSAGR